MLSSVWLEVMETVVVTAIRVYGLDEAQGEALKRAFFAGNVVIV